MASDAHAAHGANHPHVTPLKTYFMVFGALLICTVLTYAVSFAGFEPRMSIVIALAVASVKAFLVCAFFMHLLHDAKFNVFVFASALWFAVIFWVFTMADVGSRGAILESVDNFTHRTEAAAAAAAAAASAAPAAAPPAAPAKDAHGGH
jgi:cytochrome c oxidase subunit IV